MAVYAVVGGGGHQRDSSFLRFGTPLFVVSQVGGCGSCAFSAPVLAWVVRAPDSPRAMMLRRFRPRGSPHRRPRPKSAGRHRGAGAWGRPNGGPHLLLLSSSWHDPCAPCTKDCTGLSHRVSGHSADVWPQPRTPGTWREAWGIARALCPDPQPPLRADPCPSASRR